MTSDHERFDQLENMWKQQEVTEMNIDIDSIVNKATKLQRAVKIRNILEWSAGAFLMVWCSIQAYRAEALLEMISYFALAIGAVFVSLFLVRNGRLKRMPEPADDTGRFVAAHRDQLRSQARLLKTVPFWYLAPLAIGAFGLVAQAAVEVSAAGRGMWIVALSGLLVLVCFTGVAFINLRKAKQLRTEADAIDVN